MSGLENLQVSYWWVFPLVLMILCCFGVRRRGSGMCGFRSRRTDSREIYPVNSAIAILDKRYALGEISGEEYEEKRRTIGKIDM